MGSLYRSASLWTAPKPASLHSYVLLGQRASPRTIRSARSRSSRAFGSRRPRTRRIRSRRSATILSVMIWERRRRPLLAPGSTVGRNRCVGPTSDDIGQMTTVVVACPNSSAWTTTAGRGFPKSPAATTRTMSPRFTTDRQNRRRPRSSHQWPNSPGVAIAMPLPARWRREYADCASRGPNAGPAANLVPAIGHAERACGLAPSSEGYALAS